MKKLLAGLIIGAALTGGVAQAGSVAGERAVYERVKTRSGNEPNRIVLLCDGIAEDSLATLRLVKYEATELAVYRCVTP